MRGTRRIAATVVLGLLAAMALSGPGTASAGPAADWQKERKIAAEAWTYAEKTWPNHFSGVWGIKRERFRYDFAFAFTANPARKVAELREKFPTSIAKYLPRSRTYSFKYLDGLLTQMITDRRRIKQGRLKPPGRQPGRFDLGIEVAKNKVNLYKPFFAPGYKRWFQGRYGKAIRFVKSGLAQW